MTFNQLSNNKLVVAGVALVGLYIISRIVGGRLGDTAYKVVQAVNPANPDNLVYSGLNAVGDITDDGEDDNSFSLGAWIYNVTHEDEFDAIFGGD